MEFIVGTTVGATGLVVGLATLFTTCLQVWDFVDAGKAHVTNFSLLRTKLDNQRILFMIWGTALGFGSQSGYDARLDDPRVKPTIEANLHHIIRMFSETETLSKRYGIDVIKKESHTLVGTSTNAVFQPKHASFLEKLRKQEKDISLWRVTRWAIRDEHKFDVLAKDLRGIIEDLERITNKFISLSELVDLAQDAVEDINDLQSLEEIQEATGGAPTIVSDTTSIRHRTIEERTNSTVSVDDSFYTAPTTNVGSIVVSGTMEAIPAPDDLRVDRHPEGPSQSRQRLQSQETKMMELLTSSMLREARALRIISVVALFYLPATFVSTFFSTDVFKYQDRSTF
ncbi:prion-inhibition and propagation-domain-containing protein [Amylocarpus encephaloides]|uniref:Prion-inhibition and propagation-domain-containing protein n=1 Tax=Amylocarpus encephaloides TaxID=45428 RepID=A0A9P7Y9J4_9HELO|nr:prion-inhibition and propagation-domain-containing protein [Amylocarpus encephaloides]